MSNYNWRNEKDLIARVLAGDERAEKQLETKAWDAYLRGGSQGTYENPISIITGKWVMENFTSVLKHAIKDRARVLSHALLDINWLLVNGFDTDVDKCTIPGVRETIEEIRELLAESEVSDQ